MLQRLFHDFGPGHIDEYACGPKSFQLRVSQWFPTPRYNAYCTIWVKTKVPLLRGTRRKGYLNAAEYMSPPLVHRSFKPRSSARGVFGPTLRSKISP